MNRALLALFRGALHLYPRSFRREYEPALVQTVLDQCTFGGRSVRWVVLRELPDVAGSALRMRGESPMSKFVVVILALAAALLAALTAGPIALVPVAVVAVAVLAGMRNTPSLDAASSGHPMRWLLAGVIAIGAGVAIPVLDGGELSEPAWAAMAMFIVAGIVLGLTGFGYLFAAGRSSQPTPTR